MFEHAFRNINDILHEGTGGSSKLEITDPTSWLMPSVRGILLTSGQADSSARNRIEGEHRR